jgi:hypothetical protein
MFEMRVESSQNVSGLGGGGSPGVFDAGFEAGSCSTGCSCWVPELGPAGGLWQPYLAQAITQ